MTKAFAAFASRKTAKSIAALQTELAAEFSKLAIPAGSATAQDFVPVVLDVAAFSEKWNLPFVPDERLSSRYWVIDFGVEYPLAMQVDALVSLLARQYSFGPIGLMNYWCGGQKGLPAVRAIRSLRAIEAIPYDMDALGVNCVYFYALSDGLPSSII